jgi:hypothetical protein
VAGAAAAAEDNPAQDREVFPPGEDVAAIAAVRAGRDDAFALGEAGDNDVKEAAEDESEECGEKGSYELERVADGWCSPVGAGRGFSLGVPIAGVVPRGRLQYFYDGNGGGSVR